ncbi:cupin domain-containing protein [Phenylobacterium montanum]|uniref:Cupin domain-containing protein n=1 Tax=Phenylobacterium montanum TaxID=2823693 RepID=A0A975G160_9CAUL|nr:cupin domain-containing protein [Caulobacter sp. S6]QUD89218.1 cupin domain-containing protein [Caulobacter sp. S6]
MSEADRLIAALGLQPHPEGGWYAETFRAPSPDGRRPAATAILFLLKAGEASHWHRVDAVEIWCWHRGAPLELKIHDGTGLRTLSLGPGIESGETPQGVVPESAWQAARSLGDYTLVSCAVAPGFDFAGFELAPPGFEPTP